MVFDEFDRLWRVWLFIPFVFLLVSVAIILNNNITTGSFIGRDVELMGGNRITMELEMPVDVSALQNALPDASIHTTSGVRNELLIETPPDVKEVLDVLAGFGLIGDYNLRSVGPVLGDIFWSQAQLAMVVAFILMSMVIFMIFRSPISSGIVIFSIITDVIITIAVMNIIGITLY